jgi:hypothetical protein
VGGTEEADYRTQASTESEAENVTSRQSKARCEFEEGTSGKGGEADAG